MKNKLIIVNIAVVSLLMGLLISCKTPNPCPKQPAIGNIGSMLNTGNDDYLPVVFQNRLYFTSIREDKKDKERLYYSDLVNGEFTLPKKDTILPLFYYPDSGSPTFYKDTANNILEMYFAAISPTGKINRDIFVSYFKNNTWSKPVPVSKSINTEHYESHPAIAPDGSYLVFTSDRSGGIGQIDLYISFRVKGNEWTIPKNLGPQINTVADEISPFVASDNTLLFASKGYKENSGYDIVRAEPQGKGKWGNPKVKPFPFNTEADETGPCLLNNQLFLSSNRRGGCGGFDIYAFQYCQPVLLTGKIQKKNQDIPIKGSIQLYDLAQSKVEMFDKYGESKSEISIDELGEFQVSIAPNQPYIIKYTNPCLPGVEYKKEFIAPCSDSSVVKMVLDFTLPENLNEFSFEQYNIPFFVTGYYIPNTKNNLEALRLKFSYNILGTADSTKYIENPGDEYDKFVPDVEQALSDAVDFVLSKIEYLNSECSEPNENIKISITGFTDPRPISSLGKYSGIPIDDKEFNLQVQPGEAMTNDILSTLRAYYTAKYIQSLLEKNNEYLAKSDRIKWECLGQGIDESEDLGNEYKRRVYIKVNIEK